MVKLETEDGRPVYLSPLQVVAIREHDARQPGQYSAEDCTAMWCTSGCFVVVKGTPDEVHAKLFPEERPMGFTLLERNQAMLDVLECVAEAKADDFGNIHLPDTAIALARKALGLET